MKDKLPKSWEFKKLGDIAEYINGFAFKPTDWGNSGLPIIRIQNLNGNNSYNYYDGEVNEKYLVKNGDILISWSASLDVYKWNNGNAILNQHIFNTKINSRIVDENFFYLLIKYALDEIKSQVHGVGMQHITKGKFEKINIPLPSLPEQKQIVSVLDKTFEKLDKAIALIENNIQKLKELNESVLDEVFSKLDKEENKFRLVDIADVKRGKSKHRPRNDKSLYGGSYPLIQTGDIRNAEKFITKFSQTYNEKGLVQSKLWKKGTICLTIAANIGDVAILGIDACFPDSVVGIYSKEYNNTYIYYFLKSIQRKLDEKSSASAQKNLSVEKLSDFYIPLPDSDEQQCIVEYLDQTTDKNQKLTQYYQNKLEALKGLKNSVLDSAFKGELRRAKVIPITQPVIDPYFARTKSFNTKKKADKQAMVIALAIEAHEKIGKSLYRTKGEKTVEIIEKHIDLDFGREAKKMAAGPAAFEHLVKIVEPLAKEKRWFSVQEVKGENYDSHKYIKAENFNAFMMRCVLDLKPNLQEIRRVIDLFANMRTTHEAEVVATTYSGWNNLIIRKTQIDDEAIVTEARENWHDSKLKIERQEFFNAIEWLKKNNLVPKGNGKEVN